jgi:hypothetical protein
MEYADTLINAFELAAAELWQMHDQVRGWRLQGRASGVAVDCVALGAPG